MSQTDTVDWTRIRGARGPARRVPELLRNVAAGKAKQRRQALEELSEILLAGRVITPAAVVAVPFLLALVAAAEPAEKGRLLVLLADIAVGGSHMAWLTSGYVVTSAELVRLPADHPYKTAYVGVAEGLDVYLSCFASPDAETRVGAGVLLAFLSDRAERILPVVRSRVTLESEERARASAILCLGYLARYLGSSEDATLLGRAHDESTGLCKVAAALALVQVGPATLGEEPRKTLEDALSTFSSPVAGLGWCGGEVAHFASLALACVGVEARDPALLIRLLDATANLPTQPTVVSALLDAAFGADVEPRREPRPASSLSASQRVALEAITDRKLTPRVFAALVRHSIPPLHPALLRYLGKAPGGPLDREVAGEPLWLAGWRAVRDERRVPAWSAAAVQGQSEEEVVALCADSLSPPYALADLLPLLEEDDLPISRELSRSAVRLAASTLALGVSIKRLLHLTDELAASPDASIELCAACALAALRCGALEAVPHSLIARVAAGDLASVLRELIAALPFDKREAVIVATPFTSRHEEGVDGVPVVHATGGWLIADLCPTELVARHVVSVLAELQEADPLPVARAKEIFAALGQAGMTALSEASKRPGQSRRALFAELLRDLT